MFANLESFSIFFFTCLALIILAIAFEDKLTALEKKHNRKKAAKRHAERAAVRNISRTSAKPYPTQKTAARNNRVAVKRNSSMAA